MDQVCLGRIILNESLELALELLLFHFTNISLIQLNAPPDREWIESLRSPVYFYTLLLLNFSEYLLCEFLIGGSSLFSKPILNTGVSPRFNVSAPNKIPGEGVIVLHVFVNLNIRSLLLFMASVKGRILSFGPISFRSSMHGFRLFSVQADQPCSVKSAPVRQQLLRNHQLIQVGSSTFPLCLPVPDAKLD